MALKRRPKQRLSHPDISQKEQELEQRPYHHSSTTIRRHPSSFAAEPESSATVSLAMTSSDALLGAEVPFSESDAIVELGSLSMKVFCPDL